MRAKIEASGRDARWEFDRKRLFERTDYMATICQDIYNVAEVCHASPCGMRSGRGVREGKVRSKNRDGGGVK